MKREDLQDSFIKLLQQHERIIFKLCFLYADSEVNRQDLYQEIVGQVWQAFPKFRGESKFSTWLYQVALNTALTSLRHQRRTLVTYTADGSLPELADTDSNQEDKEQLELLYSAVAQLNEIEKAVLILYLDDKSYEEMEAIMGITNGVLRVKMTRIKDKLKKITKK